MTTLPDGVDMSWASSDLPAHLEGSQQTAEYSHSLRKTIALFRERRIVQLARNKLDRAAFRRWFAQACAVQVAIYGIDHYYEQSAHLDRDVEAAFWAGIERQLLTGATAPRATGLAALRDLRKYALAERRLHAFDLIDPAEFERILYLKCADVRMARDLIWAYATAPPHEGEFRFWSVYDQCWELIEDFDDLEEDGRDWNFNFWLYVHMSGRPAPVGVDAAVSLLQAKLAELKDMWGELEESSRLPCQAALRKSLAAGRRVSRSLDKVLSAIGSGRVSTFAEIAGLSPRENRQESGFARKSAAK